MIVNLPQKRLLFKRQARLFLLVLFSLSGTGAASCQYGAPTGELDRAEK